MWAAVHVLGVAIVAGSNALRMHPLLGKSDMHAAVLDKVLLHWAKDSQIRGKANTPLEHGVLALSSKPPLRAFTARHRPTSSMSLSKITRADGTSIASRGFLPVTLPHNC